MRAGGLSAYSRERLNLLANFFSILFFKTGNFSSIHGMYLKKNIALSNYLWTSNQNRLRWALIREGAGLVFVYF